MMEISIVHPIPPLAKRWAAPTLNIIIREIEASDSVDALTELLHLAYRPLAEMGLRYMATHQSSDVTRQRIREGTCLVGVLEQELVATVVYQSEATSSVDCYYRREGVAKFGQFAVHPELQRSGIGSRILAEVERRAFSAGASEIALDTSEHSQHLIDWYQKRGYRFVEHVQWREVNYRSVIMAKSLTAKSPAATSGTQTLDS